jgi:hypothetical protein
MAVPAGPGLALEHFPSGDGERYLGCTWILEGS